MRIEAHGITVEAGGRRLLSEVGLTVRPGELLGLIGPNGAGKTTLLRVLAGLRRPQGGTVLYDGRPARAHGTRAHGTRALARRLAYLAQGAVAHWPLQAERLVALGRLPHQGLRRSDPQADRAAVEHALQRTGVADLRARTVGTLSGGERMRVLLARALAVEAEALLADEPVAALDPYHQIRVMELLHDEAGRGRAVVVVLHDLALAMRFCHRLALLHEGRLTGAGPPQAVLTDGNLAAVYRITAQRGHGDGRPYHEARGWVPDGADPSANAMETWP